MLAQLPEGTDVVVLDEEGEVVPLATQEAAEAWPAATRCGARIRATPGKIRWCTDSFPSMTALVGCLVGSLSA